MFRKALKDGMTACLIEPSENDQDVTVSAQIMEIDADKVYVKITDGKDLFLRIYKNRNFDINFTMNRSTYQMQHNCLQWIQNHSLFPVLIIGPRFCIEPESCPETEFTFS